ncbi:MAG: BPSS1780 family membrane protein [Usitatibacter sp.]
MDNATATPPAPFDPGLQLVMPGRSVTFGQAVSWVPRSWKLVKAAPLMWVLAILILFVANAVLSFLPIIGTIAANLLQPLYMAGFAVACRSLETGGDFELSELLAGFKTRSTELLIIGAVMVVGWIVIFALFMAIFVGFAGWAVFTAFFTALMANDPQQAGELLTGMLLPFLLAMLFAALLFVPLLAAYWFAPFLVLMHGVRPLAAMKASLMACIVNFLQMAVYGIVMLVIGVVVSLAMIVPILGWIFAPVAWFVLVLMSIAAIYTSYRDIFTDEVSRPEAATVTL